MSSMLDDSAFAEPIRLTQQVNAARQEPTDGVGVGLGHARLTRLAKSTLPPNAATVDESQNK